MTSPATTSPPPSLPPSPRVRIRWGLWLLIGLAAVPAACLGAFVVLRACGWVRIFAVPTGGMTPAIAAGDRVLVEGVSLWFTQPQRGDIVVFQTEGIAKLGSRGYFVMRVAGEPGERLRIADGKVVIDGEPVALGNEQGEISYLTPPSLEQGLRGIETTIPPSAYFVLGDNSANSYDSRFWGTVPRQNIIGRVAFRFWPPQRAGGVK